MNTQKLLDDIARSIVDDNVCPNLRESCTQLVFGDGNPNAKIVFVGEAPGKKEDEMGRPFVGAAGKFLDEMLASIGLLRQDIYITNIVKYRPPDNRDPSPEEKQAFMPYLMNQIAIIKPKLVVFLGRHSMNQFYPEFRISEVHGQVFRKGGVCYMPLYHPAAALYNGSMRSTLLSDFAKIPEILQQLNDPKSTNLYVNESSLIKEQRKGDSTNI